MSDEKSFFYFLDNLKSPFEVNDLKIIAKRYEIIYLFVVNKIEDKTQIPENVVVFENYIRWGEYNSAKYLLKNIFSIIGIYLNECFATKEILSIKKSFAVIVSNIFKADCILDVCNKNKISAHNSVFYSFWFYDCVYLAWLKNKNSTLKTITRTHGGDLFEYRGSLKGKVLFRNFQFKNLDYVFSVSETGTKYLQEKYSKFSYKIKTIFLGSVTHANLAPFSKDNDFVIVSCARVRNIKRVYKIAETLQYINFPLTWYHIGNENLNSTDVTVPLYKKAKEELKSNKNINYIPLGSMDNISVYDFYAKTPINLFISLSETEGIPVSMMEAVSFGIPVLSTDVGGCNEIVNEQTGILIPLETEAKQIAETITAFKNSEKNTVEYRKDVRKFWEENFDVEKNYKKFFEIVQ